MIVIPAKAGIQCMGFKWARPPTNDVLTIMDPLVSLSGLQLRGAMGTTRRLDGNS